MKAIILQNETELIEAEVSNPKPKAHEVLIQIKASGFNPIDYQMLDNEHERKLISSPILGRELSGIIFEIGEDVRNFKVGDEVYCAIGSMGSNGSYAELVTAPEVILALKPETLSHETAASIPSAGITALQIYNRLKGHWTNNVLITGASGGVGSFLIQILIAQGFGKYIHATYGNSTAFEKLKKLGLKNNQLIDYKISGWEKEFEGEHQLDLVIDLVGNKISEIATNSLRINGIYADVTALTTDDARETLFNKGIVVVNISNFAHAFIRNYAYYRDSLQQISDWFNEGILQEMDIEVVGNLSLETIKLAHQKLKNNKTNAKKLVMINTI